MKNNKAFTLIELLAVIAILAIVLLIAVPKVMDTVTSSSMSSARSSAQMIWKTAEECVIKASIDSSSCTMPTPLTGTTKGFNSTGVALTPSIASLSSFAGTYSVIMGTANTTDITSVSVTQNGSTCLITSRNDSVCNG